MNENIRCLISCCEKMNLPYTVLHHTGNAVEINLRGTAIIFANWATPLNPHSLARLCSDKEYSYEYFRRCVRMPKTKGFLDPDIDEEYRSYLHYPSHATIADIIRSEFRYPIMVKRNSGSRGRHVYVCNTYNDVMIALGRIFKRGEKGYDYVAVAQEYIDIATEYRVVYYKGDIAFMYQKIMGGITEEGNVSPLHTAGSRAEHVTRSDVFDEMRSFLLPISESTCLNFGGLDVAVDTHGQWWLIEINSAPSFSYFIRDNGDMQVVALYERILKDFLVQPGSVHQ